MSHGHAMGTTVGRNCATVDAASLSERTLSAASDGQPSPGMPSGSPSAPRVPSGQLTNLAILVTIAALSACSAETSAANAESGARYGMFVAPKRGLCDLINTLAAALPDGAVRLRSPVEALALDDGQWKIRLAGGETLGANAVIVALPAHAAELGRLP